jgi:hypothetical protein
MKPKRQWTVSGLAVELDKDRRTISRVIGDAGIEPVKIEGRSKLYHMIDVVDALNKSSRLDLSQERAMLAQEQRQKLILENRLARDEVIEISEFNGLLEKIGAVLKTRLLAFPSKLSPRLHACKSIPEVEGELKKAVNETLATISSDLDG